MNAENRPSFVIENNIIKAQKLPPLSSNVRLNETILENLKKKPDFIGQIDADTKETCTYKTLANESIRCALWLKKQGIVAEDIISIWSHNQIRTWASLCATLFLGATLNPWHHDWSPESAQYFLNLTKPKIIFASVQAAKMLAEVFKKGNVKSKIVVFGKVDGLDSFADIIKEANDEEVDNFQCYPVKDDDNALILFSSGTTGLPKGVQHTYRGVHYNIYRFNHSFKNSENIISMCTSSLYWISGIFCVLRSLLNSFTGIIINNLTPDNICEAVEKYKIQWLFLGSFVVSNMYKSGSLSKYDLSSVNEIAAGGVKMNPQIAREINNLLKNAEVIQGYASSELGAIAMLQNKGHNNFDSCGTLRYDLEMKIIDVNTGNILGPNQNGEILFRQKYMMKQYFNNPKNTAEAIDKEGWLHSGDLGYFDKEGNIFIVDRIKEVIKYKGNQIFPLEIENIIMNDPRILEVAVVPVHHLMAEEHPIAFVVTLNNLKVSEEEILEMTSVLGDAKRLQDEVVFLDKLPKTASGKIDRNKLKEMAKMYAY